MINATGKPYKTKIIVMICILSIVCVLILLFRLPNEESFLLSSSSEDTVAVGEAITLNCKLTNKSFRLFWVTHYPQIIMYSVNGVEEAVPSLAESNLVYPLYCFDRDISLSFSEPGTYEVLVFSDFTVSLFGKTEKQIHLQTNLTINVE